MKDAFNPHQPPKEPLKTNPLGLGVLRNVAGLIPASDRHPEIFYTPEAEAVAAVTLLTFLLMKPEIVAQVKEQGTKFLCSDKSDKLSAQIGQNIIENFPATRIQTSRNLMTADAHDNEKSVGMNSAAGRLVNIYRKSLRAVSRETSLEHRFLNALFDFSVSEDPDELKSTADSLYVRLPYEGGLLTLADVWDCCDDLQLKVLMEDVSKGRYGRSLTDIPRVLCHEIGHNSMIERMISGHEFSSRYDIAELNEKLPMPLPDMYLENQIHYVGAKVFQHIFLAADLKQMNAQDRKRHSYYYNNIRETKAELFGEAIVGEMNDRHGLDIPVTGFGKTMVTSYPLVKKIIEELTPSSVKPGMELESPERQMEPDRDVIALNRSQLHMK